MQGIDSSEDVRADTEMWRASGMAQLYRSRQLPDVYSERYAQYQRMRNGPEFAAAFCRRLQNER